MQKIFSTVSVAALVFCLTAPLAYGMEANGEDLPTAVAAKQATQQTPTAQLPDDIWIHHIWEINPQNVHDINQARYTWALRPVCKRWNELLTQIWGASFGSRTYAPFEAPYPEDFFKPFGGITSLKLRHNRHITANHISHLSNLTGLALPYNNTITNAYIHNLTNLTKLDLFANLTIDDTGISNLTNLISLNVGSNNKITDTSISSLTNLTKLNVAYNHTITNAGIHNLTTLTALGLSWNRTITNAGISNLTALISVSLIANPGITTDVLTRLTNLKKIKGR